MNGFNKCCPSGNHMCEGSEDKEQSVQVGDIFKDESGVEWEAFEVNENEIILYPYAGQKRFYTREQLEDEMEKQ